MSKEIKSNVFLVILMAISRRIDAGAEKELIERIARRRDHQALDMLYDTYAGILYSMVLAIVKRPEETEDVLQEIFILIWDKADTFDTGRDNVYAWLTTLARNRAIDRTRSKQYRAAQREIVEPEQMLQIAGGSTPLDATIMQERTDAVRRALSRIPPEQRVLIEMAYFEGYSQSQLARRLKLPLGTVKTRMRQGMKKLHTLLTEDL